MAIRFFTPDLIDNALALLANDGGNRCLAGGGLMVPALRAGFRPAGLVSLKRVASLKGITQEPDGSVRVGAMTTHDAVSLSADLHGGNAMVRQAAAQIAHPVIRNMATIGGTLCRADPATDYASALLAAGARVHLRAASGERVIPIDDFVAGDGETLRRDDELVVAVRLRGGRGGSSGYVRFSRVDGDYPVVTAAVRLEWSDRTVASARIAVGGCGPTAYRVPAAEAAMRGLARTDDAPAAVFEAYVNAARAVNDLKGSADYRRMLIPGLLRRALTKAFTSRPSVQ